jgi:hypothetical protein
MLLPGDIGGKRNRRFAELMAGPIHGIVDFRR